MFVVLASLPSVVAAHPTREDEAAALSRELARHPRDPVRLLKRAQLALDAGALDAARRDLEAARRADPDMAAVEFVRAQVEVAAERPEAAVAAIRRFLARAPGNLPGVVFQARLLAGLGDARTSVAAWRLALDAVAAQGRADASLYLEAAAGQPPQRALALLDEGVARCGAQPLLVKRAAHQAIALGDAPRAVALVEAWLATPLGAAQPDALALRARLLAQAGRAHDACAALATAEQALAGARRIGRRIRADAEADLSAARGLLPGCTP